MARKYFLAIKYLIRKTNKKDWQTGRGVILLDKILRLPMNEFKQINKVPELLEINSKSQDNIRILLRISRACNQNCIFCPIDNTDSNFFSYEQLKKIVEKIQICYPDQNIEFILSGGEPTLHPDYIKLIRFIIQEKKSTVTVQTNGILLSKKEIFRPLLNEDRVKYFISFHSHEENIHNLITATENNYELVVDGILNVLTGGKNWVTLNCVINYYNFKILSDYFNFIKQKFSSIRPIGLFLSSVSLNNKERDDYLIKFSEVVPKLIGLVEENQDNNLQFFGFQGICGFPLCFLQEYPKYFHKNEFEEIEEREKPHICSKCLYRQNCPGLIKQYLRKFGIEEIRPITTKLA